MNLVIALLGTKYGRSRDFLRNRINGYDPQATDDAFGRMFERDKTHLKNLGIPITSLRDPHGEGDDAWKYLIRPQDYRLPQIRLDPEGLAVLSLAARVWEQASLGSSASRMKTVPSSQRTSINSPCWYPGRPQTESSARSASSSERLIPNSSATASASMPEFCTKKGTRSNSLRSRSSLFGFGRRGHGPIDCRYALVVMDCYLDCADRAVVAVRAAARH